MTASRCEMTAGCPNPVTHIGAKGYIYCASCAPKRRGVERVRRMRPWELKLVLAGNPLPTYKPGPAPKRAPAIRVLVTVDGGIVQSVEANVPGVTAVIHDTDKHAEAGDEVHVSQYPANIVTDAEIDAAIADDTRPDSPLDELLEQADARLVL